jgi:hypothetical protein
MIFLYVKNSINNLRKKYSFAIYTVIKCKHIATNFVLRVAAGIIHEKLAPLEIVVYFLYYQVI